MEKIELQSDNRVILGKGVKVLRKQKVTPLHLFGSGQDSQALQCDTNILERVLSRAGETRLITLTIADQKKTRPVLVREVQRDALTGILLHVDLYEVNMKEKVEVEVPVVLVGEAPALKIKGNSIAQELDTLTVSCLPDAIPNKVEVNVSSLLEHGNAIHVKDITGDHTFAILNNPEQTIVVISVHIERVEEKVVKEAPAATAAEEAKPTETKPTEAKAKQE